MIRLIFSCLLILNVSICQAGHSLSDDEFSIFVDSANLSFTELLSQEQKGLIGFKPFEGNSPKEPVIWIKIEDQVISGADYLYLSNYMDQIEVFYADSSDYYSIGGRIIDYNRRSFPYGFYRNVVAIYPEKGTTYLKVSSFHGYSIQNQSFTHIEAVSAKELNSDTAEIFTSTTLITGMEIIILILNLALWWLSKDRTVGFYIAVIASGVGMAIFQNQTFMHFFDISMNVMGWVEIILNFILIYFFHAFSSHYLMAKEHSPRLHKTLTLPFFPIVLALAFIQKGALFPIAATTYFLTSFGLIFIVLYRSWRLHRSKAIVYLIANFVLVIFAMGLILALNEIVPHRFLTTNLPFLSFLLRDTIFTIDLIRNYFDASKKSLERKLTIDQLTEEKEHLKKIEEIKTRFFNNVSHELRTPLTLILSPLEDSIRSGKIPKDVERDLNLSLKNGKYLLQLVNEMLDLSKLDKGELVMIREPFEVVSFCTEIRENFKAFAKEKSQQLFITHTSGKLIANLDRDKFEKILNNLISNAIKYSDQPGSIYIQLKEIDRDLELRVVDQGRGIAEGDLPKVFDRYYQAAADKAAGTGIGLSIVKEFTNLHGGSVECKSEFGVGTTFVLKFPDSIVHEDFDSQIPQHADHSKLTVMILEDHGELRSYLKEKFEDYNVIACRNGQEGIDALERGISPSLIITDFVMPEMDGYEFAQKVKQKAGWRTIPIIFLTARSLTSDKLKVLNLGVDDYIIKPFDINELKVRVKNAIRTYRAIKKAHEETELELPQNDIKTFKEELDHFILDNISNSALSNEDILDHFSLSERSLYRKVKAVSGKTPASYIREMRLQKGRMLILNEGALTISEVAFACGAENVSHFTQLFKKRFGVTPSKMQEMTREVSV